LGNIHANEIPKISSCLIPGHQEFASSTAKKWSAADWISIAKKQKPFLFMVRNEAKMCGKCSIVADPFSLP